MASQKNMLAEGAQGPFLLLEVIMHTARIRIMFKAFAK